MGQGELVSFDSLIAVPCYVRALLVVVVDVCSVLVMVRIFVRPLRLDLLGCRHCVLASNSPVMYCRTSTASRLRSGALA